MPLVRIAVPAEFSQLAIAHISDAVHNSMVETFNVPVKDRFQIISRHAAHELSVTPEYLGIEHSDLVVLIQITCNEGRTLAMKQGLYAAIAASVSAGGVVRAEDVIINLVEVTKDDWSFGKGIAQYAV